MTQQLLFESGDIRITSTVAQFGGTSYQIATIGGVSISQHRTRRPVTVAIFILGAFIVAGSLLSQHFEMTATGTAARSGQLILSGGVIMFGAVLLQLVWPGRRYLVIFKTARGDIEALRSRKKDLVVRVKQAIEQAFIARGAQA
jgi:Family of unknown function (DUF6232)